MKTISRIISTFFGLGYFPIAPGTMASLAVILIYRFWLTNIPWYVFWGVFIILFFLGVYTSSLHARDLDREDPRCIVIDEVVGQFLVLFRLPSSWPLLIVAFLLFRFFDIFKPFPIKRVEVFPSGWGIMLDDLVAALYAGIIINLYLILK